MPAHELPDDTLRRLAKRERRRCPGLAAATLAMLDRKDEQETFLAEAMTLLRKASVCLCTPSDLEDAVVQAHERAELAEACRELFGRIH